MWLRSLASTRPDRRKRRKSSLLLACINYFSVKLTIKREKYVFWKVSFLQNKNFIWLRLQNFVYNTSWLAIISPLIRSINKELRVEESWGFALLYRTSCLVRLCVSKRNKIAAYPNTENVFYCLSLAMRIAQVATLYTKWWSLHWSSLVSKA